MTNSARSALKGTKDGSCQCAVCVLSHKVQAVQAKLSPEDQAVIEELLNAWASESMDAGRAQSFLAGYWPGARPIAASKCLHDWEGDGEPAARWTCKCGTLVYRSYEDYCDG